MSDQGIELLEIDHRIEEEIAKLRGRLSKIQIHPNGRFKGLKRVDSIERILAHYG